LCYGPDASLDRHTILTIRNLTRRALRFIEAVYERDYSEKEGDQADASEDIANASVVPGANTQLFRERANLAIRHRSIVFCHHFSPFGVADFCRCGCAEQVSPTDPELKRASRFLGSICRRNVAYHLFTGDLSRGRSYTWIVDRAFVCRSIDGLLRLFSNLLPARSEHTAGRHDKRCSHSSGNKACPHSPRLGERLMPNVFGGGGVNRILRDVGGVVTNPLQATCDKDQIEIAAELFGVLRHSFD
jgi:hypothetical protein